MEYKVIMPILSDTMDKGKIVKWLVKVGDYVKKDSPVVEVESDKATMQIEAGVEGVVKKILASVGEEVPVKTPIAIIDTEQKAAKIEESKPQTQTQPQTQPKEEKKETVVNIDEILNEIISSPKAVSGSASPAAKKKAAEYGINIEELQKKKEIPKPAHLKDIDEMVIKKYFTPKAARLIKEYSLDINDFKLDHKIRSEEVLNYIKQNNIPKITKLTPNKIAVIKNVQNSIKKPTFLIFEKINITKKEGIKLTAQIIKALALAMQKNPLTRSVLKDDKLLTYPASNISVAVNRDDGLYMCVIKNAEDKTLEEINEWLKEIKTKRLTIEDLSGSTFGISNLGMFGIERFTALINDKDAGIGAFGKMNEGEIKVTFTIDHRILNGVEAAKFVNDFKKEIQNV